MIIYFNNIRENQLYVKKGALHKAQFLGHWIGDVMTWLDQEKVRASHGGLGDTTQGAGTTIPPQIGHT